MLVLEQDNEFDNDLLNAMTFKQQLHDVNTYHNFVMMRASNFPPHSKSLGDAVMCLQSRFDHTIKECEHF